MSDQPDNQTQVTITQSENDPEVYIRKSPSSSFIVEYHKDMCIGIGSCAAIAPGTFEMNDENKAELIHSFEVDADDAILAAAQSCPVFAIIIKDAETGEQIFPPQ